MWKSMDKRAAAFLPEETSIEDTDLLHITHKNIANHLGTHREVVTRTHLYFQREDMGRLTRGAELTDRTKLEALSGE